MCGLTVWVDTTLPAEVTNDRMEWVVTILTAVISVLTVWVVIIRPVADIRAPTAWAAGTNRFVHNFIRPVCLASGYVVGHSANGSKYCIHIHIHILSIRNQHYFYHCRGIRYAIR